MRSPAMASHGRGLDPSVQHQTTANNHLRHQGSGCASTPRYLIDQAWKQVRFDKFGGEVTVRVAEKALDRVENQLQQLLHADS